MTRVVESLVRTAEIIHSLASVRLTSGSSSNSDNKKHDGIVTEMTAIFAKIEKARRTTALFQHHVRSWPVILIQILVYH